MVKSTAVLFTLLFFCCKCIIAQKNTPLKQKRQHIQAFARNDTSKKYDPRIAIVRSAILPGWGQITNKKYWKLPLVYGALGITAGIFVYNVNQYKVASKAYTNATDGDPSNDYLIPEPYYSVRQYPDRIKTFRNQVRQNVDYSALFFILFWGLNVVDAAVDAHLKTFDVSNELGFKIRSGYSPLANTNGLSFVINIGKHENGK